MNKKRLTKLVKVLAALDSSLAVAIDNLGDIRDEEQEAYDNLPESLQGGEGGARMLLFVENIENLIEALEQFQSDASGIEEL